MTNFSVDRPSSRTQIDVGQHADVDRSSKSKKAASYSSFRSFYNALKGLRSHFPAHADSFSPNYAENQKKYQAKYDNLLMDGRQKRMLVRTNVRAAEVMLQSAESIEQRVGDRLGHKTTKLNELRSQNRSAREVSSGPPASGVFGSAKLEVFTEEGLPGGKLRRIGNILSGHTRLQKNISRLRQEKQSLLKLHESVGTVKEKANSLRDSYLSYAKLRDLGRKGASDSRLEHHRNQLQTQIDDLSKSLSELKDRVKARGSEIEKTRNMFFRKKSALAPVRQYQAQIANMERNINILQQRLASDAGQN